MSRRHLLLRLLFKAAWVRKDRALTALISVAVVATIATAALTIYSDLEGKLSREFRGFGANVIVTKAAGALSAGELAAINATVGAKAKVVPVAYAIAAGPGDAKVVVGGADLGALRDLNSPGLFARLRLPEAKPGLARMPRLFSRPLAATSILLSAAGKLRSAPSWFLALVLKMTAASIWSWPNSMR